MVNLKRNLSILIALFVFTSVLSFEGQVKKVNAVAEATITLVKSATKIPSSSSQGLDLVKKGQILYKVTVKATVKTPSGSLIKSNPITFSNSNTSSVKLVSYSSTTNSSGVAYAYYEVRGRKSFTCKASLVVKSSSSYVATKSLSVTPTESAKYASKFYITCYNTASESDFSGSKISVAGISGYKFKKDFIAAVKLNGSGYSSNGFYIRYTGSDKYEKGKPKTCSGTTPTVGKTIAVDNYYIPRYNKNGTYLRGCVNIESIGYRRAEDSGGAINKYHIDVYVGNGKKAVNNFKYSTTYKTVTYKGNNKELW